MECDLFLNNIGGITFVFVTLALLTNALLTYSILACLKRNSDVKKASDTIQVRNLDQEEENENIVIQSLEDELFRRKEQNIQTHKQQLSKIIQFSNSIVELKNMMFDKNEALNNSSDPQIVLNLSQNIHSVFDTLEKDYMYI